MPPSFSHLAFIVAAIGLAALTNVPVRAQPTAVLLQQGEVFDRKFEAGEALKYYLAAARLEPDNADLQVRIARQYRHLMSDTPSKEEKLRLGRLAIRSGERAAELAPQDAEAQVSVAITYGKMLPFLGSKEQVETSPRIKAAVERTLRLDARHDIAWHILGRWQRTLAEVSAIKRTLAGALYGRLPKGSDEEARKCFEKAIEINPNRLMHYIELARVYVRLDRKDDARRFLNKGLAMPSVEKDDPETKARGREVLEKLR
jgi:tetratricopeptide (TPR) repeat protein